MNSENVINQNSVGNTSIQNNTPEIQKKSGKTKKPLVIVGITLVAIILVLIIIGFALGLGEDTNSPSSVIKNYINALIEQDYEKAFSYILLPEKAFVDSNDYFEYVKKQTYFDTLRTQKIKSVKEDYTSETETEYKLVLKDSSGTTTNYKVHLEKNYNDEWKIVEKDLYITDWSIIIPANTKLYINNKEVSRDYINNTEGLNEEYLIPAISSSKKLFKLENSLQDKEVPITPLSSNSGEKIYLELKDKELLSKALTYIKDTWNLMYTDYINGVDVSDVASKYFVEDMSIEEVETYYTKAFDSLTKGTSGYKYVNYVLIEAVPIDNTDNYVISANTITLNFAYKLSWSWTFTNDYREMANFTKIRLRVDGDSFKIYEVPETDFFSYASEFTKKY